MLAVADRQVTQRDDGAGGVYHGAASKLAQATASHSSDTAGNTASTRSQAEQAKRLG